jgi:hypothetical protein
MRAVQGWANILSQVDAYAEAEELTPYNVKPTAYRFDGWGLVFYPMPKLACNVKYFTEDGTVLDLGRVVG